MVNTPEEDGVLGAVPLLLVVCGNSDELTPDVLDGFGAI